MGIRYLQHAIDEMEERDISQSMVEETINKYDSTVAQKKNRTVYQKIYMDKGLKKEMLLRVITEPITSNDLWVITTYKTSNINKYIGG